MTNRTLDVLEHIDADIIEEAETYEVPKRSFNWIGRTAAAFFVCLCLLGAGTLYTYSAQAVPSDFSFSIVWGVCGISSYDSKSGKLIKTKMASDAEKYTACVTLSEEELKLIYHYLCEEIDLSAYPAVYDPFNAPDAQTVFASEPSQTIVISVTANRKSYTVSCEGILLAYAADLSDCYCEEAKAFMRAENHVVSLLTSLPEWQALPDYDVFYE